MRPIPASRFQLMPQPGSAVAIIRSALRYADSAIVGMPSAPGVFTTTVGGGADAVAAAMWKPIFGMLDGDHQRARRVGGGGRDRGNRGDGGVAQRRPRHGERWRSGAYDSGEDQAGDHRHTECRAPGRAGQQLLHCRDGGTTAAGIRRAPRAARTTDCRTVVRVVTRAARHLWGARHANYPLPHLCKGRSLPRSALDLPQYSSPIRHL